MIGQNDIAGEVFGLDDAHQLATFAELNHLGRVSMWSANRDQDCGPNYPNVQVVSDSCSGVAQSVGEFAGIFGSRGRRLPLRSRPAQRRAPPNPPRPAPSPGSSTIRRPRPYPIWNVNQSYPKGTKIVWHRNVYQAKWYTTGDQPDIPVASADLTPWTLIGPGLAGRDTRPHTDFAGRHLPGLERRRTSTSRAVGCCWTASVTRRNSGRRARLPARHPASRARPHPGNSSPHPDPHGVTKPASRSAAVAAA